MQQSRGPARFCCLEASKNATVSWSGLFLVSRSLKKCNSLVVWLVFAVQKPQKMQSLEIVFQKGLPGVSPTMAKKWSVFNKIVVLERHDFEACQNSDFGRSAGWLPRASEDFESVVKCRGLGPPKRFYPRVVQF